ncbi:MAG: phosphohistidine phosphatase SixA [Elusimicrobia bacterium]|nr:phosphohistidine phosphatase SixA [Elusimicrobiota bacterium]
MLLILMRHGPAGDREAWAKAGKDDAQRPLTKEGRDKTAKAAAGLAKLLKGLDLVATSPLKRARQTADLAADRFPKAERAVFPELSPSRSPVDAVRRLARLDEKARVVLVGHEPHLSRLAALLILGRGASVTGLKKAGAALIEFDGACRPGSGRLTAVLAPKVLRRLRK